MEKIYLFIALIIYTLFVSYIGFRFRKSKNSEDFFLASRSLPAWLLAITFIASWWGGGSAVDLVDVSYREGIGSFWIYGVPVLISTALMFVFSKQIREIATLTQPQIMEKRYDKRSALMLSIFIIIFMSIGASIQVIVIGNFFQSFLGMTYETGAIVGTLFVILYSMFGGFRGVVLTDLLQFVFFLISGIILFFITYNGVGGFEEMIDTASSKRDPNFLSFFSGLESNLAYIITFGTSWMVQANVWQRISAARTGKDARKMMAISFVVFIPLYLMVTLTGMFAIGMYDTAPEGGIVAAILSSMENPIVSGIIFIGLCSAIMSTMDSMFNTGALTLTVDIYQKYINPNASDKLSVNIGRVSTVLIACISLFIGVKIKSVLTISWIGADFIATGAFVPLVLGLVWKRGTSKGAFASMIFGLCLSSYNLLVALGVDLPVAWEIASAKQAIIGIICSFIIYISVSLLSNPTRKLH